jgi:phage N-6-adenine-methyltransferase
MLDSGLITPEEYVRELMSRNQAVKLDHMPQRRGKSKQDFQTPKDFLYAIESRFGVIAIDLAARKDNAVCEQFISPEQDSLKQDWAALRMLPGEVAFVNPPFSDLDPWAAQLETTRYCSWWTLMLCPASVSSNWYIEHVRGKVVEFSMPRLKFIGADSTYPKDLILLAAGFGAIGYGHFDWRKQ